MRLVLGVAVVAFLGAVVAAILFFAGVTDVGSVAYVLGAIALAGGFTAVICPLGDWGVPGDEGW